MATLFPRSYFLRNKIVFWETRNEYPAERQNTASILPNNNHYFFTKYQQINTDFDLALHFLLLHYSRYYSVFLDVTDDN